MGLDEGVTRLVQDDPGSRDHGPADPRDPRPLVVKLTAGDDAPERCVQGLTVAAVAAAAGSAVSLWLTGESVWLVAGRDLELPHSPPASELLAGVLSLGTVTACTQCLARRSLSLEDLMEGVVVGGAAGFVAAVLEDGVQALVY